MRNQMRLKIHLLLVCIILFSFRIEGQIAIPGNQIIDEDEIRSAGLTNLSDLFLLIDKWNVSTIDGFNWYLSANYLSTYERQNIIVMVDGQRINLNTFEMQNVNLLPFTIRQIDYVEIINLPGIYSGEFTGSGLIHFHLKEPQNNLSSHFTYSTGNETGDPGPYKFTEFESSNIDKINLVIAADLNYKSNNWQLLTGIKKEENFNTDEKIISRIKKYPSTDKSKLISGFGRLKINPFNRQIDGMKSEHSFFSFYSEHNDMLYFKHLGNEQPVKRTFVHTGLNGNEFLNRRIKLNYSLSAGSNRITEWNSINPDWHIYNYSFNLEAVYNHDVLNTTFGISLKSNNLATSQKIMEKSVSFKSIYLNGNFNSSKSLYHQISIYSTGYKNKYSVKGVVNNHFVINSTNSLTGIFSISNSLFEEDLNYWVWNSKGYTFGNEDNHFLNKDVKKSTLVSGDIIHKFSFDNSTFLESGIFYRYFKDYYLADMNFMYSIDDDNFLSSFNIFENNSLQLTGISTTLVQILSGSFSYKFSYSFQDYFSGNELFTSTWNKVSRHKAALTVNYKPVSSFGIWSRLSYFSPTQWNDYNYVQQQSIDKYSSQVKRGLIWDVAFQKWFGKRLIWTNIVFRNILADKEYYHPIGAEFDLRFFIQISINLENLPE